MSKCHTIEQIISRCRLGKPLLVPTIIYDEILKNFHFNSHFRGIRAWRKRFKEFMKPEKVEFT